MRSMSQFILGMLLISFSSVNAQDFEVNLQDSMAIKGCDFSAFEQSPFLKDVPALRSVATLGKWGTYGSTYLIDEMTHMPEDRYQEFLPKYNDNIKTKIHESRHIVNNRVDNWFDKQGIYIRNGKGFVFEGARIHKQYLGEFIPQNLRGSRYSTYISPGSFGMKTDAMYMFDEFSAYLVENEFHMEAVDKNFWTHAPHYVENNEGALEFIVYITSVYRALQKYNPSYFEQNPNFMAFMSYQTKRSMLMAQTVEKDPKYKAIKSSAGSTYLANMAKDAGTKKAINELLGPECADLAL